MTLALRGPSGEQPLVPAYDEQVQPVNPDSATFPLNNYDAFYTTVAALAEGYYGLPVQAELYVSAEAHSRAFLERLPDFIDPKHERCHPDQGELAHVMRLVTGLLELDQAGRPPILEVSYDRWDHDKEIGKLVELVHGLYRADPGHDVIREDAGDIYGTVAVRATSGTTPFLLVARCVATDMSDGLVIMRRLEVVDASAAPEVSNWLSFREDVRVATQLDRMAISVQERAYVHAHANRFTVQRDEDLQKLVEEYRSLDPSERERFLQKLGQVATEQTDEPAQVQPATGRHRA